MADNSKDPVIYAVKEIWDNEGLSPHWKKLLDEKPRAEWLKGHGQYMLSLTYTNKEGKVEPLFDKVTISQAKDSDGKDIFIRSYKTTREKLKFYNENIRGTLKDKIEADYPGTFNEEHPERKNRPVDFKFSDPFSEKWAMEAAAMCQKAEGKSELELTKIYEKDAHRKIIYGVRIDLKAEPKLNPPFSEWLTPHLYGEAGKENDPGMMQLNYGGGKQPLFTGNRRGQKEYGDGSESFLIEYNTTEGKFANYVENFAVGMRSIIEKTYPGIFTPGQPLHGVMSADRATVPLENASIEERNSYDRMEAFRKSDGSYQPGIRVGFKNIGSDNFVRQIGA